jgi:hypothetical protein
MKQAEDAAMSPELTLRGMGGPSRTAMRDTASSLATGKGAERAAVPPAPPLANPRLRLDPALGMVVLEFRGTPGLPERTIPNAQQLAAYRAAALTGAPMPGQPPAPAEAR